MRPVANSGPKFQNTGGFHVRHVVSHDVSPFFVLSYRQCPSPPPGRPPTASYAPTDGLVLSAQFTLPQSTARCTEQPSRNGGLRPPRSGRNRPSVSCALGRGISYEATGWPSLSVRR